MTPACPAARDVLGRDLDHGVVDQRGSGGRGRGHQAPSPRRVRRARTRRSRSAVRHAGRSARRDVNNVTHVVERSASGESPVRCRIVTRRCDGGASPAGRRSGSVHGRGCRHGRDSAMLQTTTSGGTKEIRCTVCQRDDAGRRGARLPSRDSSESPHWAESPRRAHSPATRAATPSGGAIPCVPAEHGPTRRHRRSGDRRTFRTR